MNKKIVRSIFLCFLLLMLFSACDSKQIQKRFKNILQTDILWVEKNEEVFVYCTSKYDFLGYMNTEKGEIPTYWSIIVRESRIELFPIENCDLYGDQILVSGENRLEKWKVNFNSDKKFTAVVQETTFCEVGEKLVFHKVDPAEYPDVMEKLTELWGPNLIQ